MENQLSFSDCEYLHKRRQIRKEKFLTRMETLVPWQRIEAFIEPQYPWQGNGRRPYPLITMLRIHCLQQWYSLSDPAMEDALYEIASMRLFTGPSLDKPIPDHKTIMNFRHLLERNALGRQILEEVNNGLTEAGVLVKDGTLMDAIIIEAPSSTKNKAGVRDPQMHQTKKGNLWHFGLKAHIGVDARTGLTYSLETTAANEHDLNQADRLLYGDEQFVFADAGYRGIDKQDNLKDKAVDWHIAERPGIVRVLKKHPRINKYPIKIEYMKASILAKFNTRSGS